MFGQSLKGFASQFEKQPFLFICRDIAETEAFIRAELARMDPCPAEWQIIVLDAATSGQADTVYQGLKKVEVAKDTALTIFNIDSQHNEFRYPDTLDLAAIDGYLEVFRASGDHWSFVLPDLEADQPFVVAEVVEKRRISDLCSSGLYYFREAALFMDCFEESLADNLETLDGGERYVAPLFSRALARNCDIRFAETSRDNLSFTGTPDEYHAELRRQGPSIAFCISGQLRGPKLHQARINELAVELGADVFVSTWSARGRKNFDGATGIHQLCRILGTRNALLLPQNLFQKMHIAFPQTNLGLNLQGMSVAEELGAVYPSAVIDIEDSGQLSLFLRTQTSDVNSLRMLYKLWRCNQLKQRAEELRGKPYDYVIRFRPDCLPDVKAFLEGRIGSNEVHVPPSEHDSGYVNDIYWMGSSEQDDYLASLFGRAVAFRRAPWSNIHRELAQLLDGAPFGYTRARRSLNFIIDDAGPEEQTRSIVKMATELQIPNAELKNLLGGEQQCQTLSALLMLSTNLSPEAITLFLKHCAASVFRPSPAVLRGILVLALELVGETALREVVRARELMSLLLAREAGINADVIMTILERYLVSRDVAKRRQSDATPAWIESVFDDVAALGIEE